MTIKVPARKRAPGKEMTKAEAVSYIVMGFMAFVAMTVGIILVGAVFLMFFWGYIAPVFGLPLLSLPAAASIMAIMTMMKLWFR